MMKKFICLTLFTLIPVLHTEAQDIEVIRFEIAKAPSFMEESKVYNFGTRMVFFLRESEMVTGLIDSSNIESLVSNTGKNLKWEHEALAKLAVATDYRMAKDTALIPMKDFHKKPGIGMAFRVHSWILPDSTARSITVKGNLAYSVVEEPDELITEDLTHLVGWMEDISSLEFKGNIIKLDKNIRNEGGKSILTFYATITNQDYQTAVKSMEFLDHEGNVLDVINFGFKNKKFNSYVKNGKVDLKTAAIVRMKYRPIKIKRVPFEKTFGLGF